MRKKEVRKEEASRRGEKVGRRNMTALFIVVSALVIVGTNASLLRGDHRCATHRALIEKAVSFVETYEAQTPTPTLAPTPEAIAHSKTNVHEQVRVVWDQLDGARQAVEKTAADTCTASSERHKNVVGSVVDVPDLESVGIPTGVMTVLGCDGQSKCNVDATDLMNRIKDKALCAKMSTESLASNRLTQKRQKARLAERQ